MKGGFAIFFVVLLTLFVSVSASKTKILINGLSGDDITFDESTGSLYFKKEVGFLYKRSGIKNCGPKLPFGVKNVTIAITTPKKDENLDKTASQISYALLQSLITPPGVHVLANYEERSVFTNRYADEYSLSQTSSEIELDVLAIKKEILEELEDVLKLDMKLEPLSVMKSADVPKSLYSSSLHLQMDPTQFFRKKSNIQSNVVKEEYSNFDFASYYFIPFHIGVDEWAVDETGKPTHTLFVSDQLADVARPQTTFKSIYDMARRSVGHGNVQRFAKRYENIVSTENRHFLAVFTGHEDKDRECEVQEYLVLKPASESKHGALVKMLNLRANGTDNDFEVRILTSGSKSKEGNLECYDHIYTYNPKSGNFKKKEMGHSVLETREHIGWFDRYLEGSGLHRKVTTEVQAIDTPIFSNEKDGDEKCTILMMESLNEDKYIDSYEVADIERFYGQPNFLLYRDINVEIPTSHATTNVAFIMNTYNTTESMINITYPIHFRYQSPSLIPQKKFNTVYVFPPTLYTNCTFKEDTSVSPIINNIRGWFDERYFYLFHEEGSKNQWTPLAWEVRDENTVSGSMPLGQWTHSSLVTWVTLGITTGAAAMILLIIIFKD